MRVRSIEIQDLLFKAEQLAAQRGKACTHNIGHPFVARIGDDPQQFLDAFASDQCDDPKLGKMTRIALITEVCWRMDDWRVRCSISPLCCSGVLVGTNRILALCHRFTNCFSVPPYRSFCRLT